jgi:hypothetical protein
MSLPDNLQKGDPLVLVSADNNKEPRNVVVSRVGRAWVYVCREGETEETRDQFNRATGVSKENHGWARWLVTPEQHADMKEREQLLADLREAGVEIKHQLQDTVPLVKLRGLLAVMKGEEG